jgi:SWI/SNF-related matrix-associated actin-dependent regulator 1 of chromatin subfamily A
LASPTANVHVDHENTCFIRSPYEPELRRAIRAIPGRFWDPDEKLWRIRLGPDRAEAVARLIRSFPNALVPDENAAHRLDLLRRRRDPRSPGIESVVAEGVVCLNICDDVDHPVLGELRRDFEVVAHPEIGRVLIPIDPDSQQRLLEAVSQPGVRLHQRARGLLDPRSLPRRQAASGLPTTPSRPAAWRGWVSTAVVDGKPRFVFATRGGIVPGELAQAKGFRRTGEDVATIPMIGAHRDLVERLLQRHRQLLADYRTVRCLDYLDPARPDDPPPPAVMTVDHEAETPEFRVQMLWAEDVLDDLADLPESRLLLDADVRYGGGSEQIDGAVVADASSAVGVKALVTDHAVELDDEARLLLEHMLDEHANGEELVRLSQAHGADFVPPPGLAGELMPFQTAGVAYALRQRRAFIADEQGLGKTIQALAAIEAADAYPAVVVCPASLKLNWLREVARWLPGRRADTISGRTGGSLPIADIIVVNYDVLDAHADTLAALGPEALVFDESHYCKNPKARRTKALIQLSEQLPRDALRLALTGTPLVNRPAELVPQLRALRTLDHFGTGASFARRFRGEDARRRLHWHLRSSCYVRRRKEEVLTQLPPKRRITVPVPLTNDAEYRRLELDLIEWLRDIVHDPKELDQKIDTALRAEALVKLNALRHVAARGKLPAAIEWIETFTAAGEPLVVFAHHRDVQAALLDAFPDAARIVGTDSLAERDANVERFQNEEAELCICSLEAASHGFTLTAAASVAFIELGWTPAKHDQAEDRVHRIGQDRHVTAWYLLAADTIDERIAALIDYKRAVVDSVTDGTASGEAAVVDRLLRELAADDAAMAA